ncbi:MAG: hypothetical protein N2512_07335 [Armatimonadetes bacterium]|nr:hypothetical protein [Armatimonadota bacterium]
MTMVELVAVQELPVAPRSLHEFVRLRGLLSHPDQSSLFGDTAAAHSLLTGWVGATWHCEVLAALLNRVVSSEEEGGCFFIQGPTGVGKTHLLLALGAAAGYPHARPALGEIWGLDGELRARLSSMPACLVVPVPLADHRGSSEPLEEVLFVAAEEAAAAPPFGLRLSLSRDSYALKLLHDHVVHVPADVLDAEARSHGYASWREMEMADRRLAAALVRSLAVAESLSVSLMPSPSERLSALVQALPRGTPVFWLVDDLNSFVEASGPKGAREDLAVLEFLAQRCKIMPLYIVAAGQRLPAGTNGRAIEKAIFAEVLSLSSEHLRPLLRVCYRGAGQDRGQLAAEAADRQAKVWPDLAPPADLIEETYPFDPLALQVLEKAGARVLGVGNFALRALHDHPDELVGRQPWQLVELRAAARWLLQAAVGAAPAEQLQEVFDYYGQRAAEIWPQDAAVVGDVVGVLLAAQLAGETLTDEDVSRAMGLDGRGWPRLTPREAEKLLAALARVGPYVRSVAMGDRRGYVVVWRLAAHEQARREFERIRAGIAATDRRLVAAALEALAAEGSPFVGIVGGDVFEVSWQHAPRYAYVELTDARSLDEGKLVDLCRALVDPDRPETAALLVGLPFERRRQLEAWRAVAEHLVGRPGAEGLVLWLPREPAASELEDLRTLVACAQAEELGRAVESALTDHAAQERLAATPRAQAALLTMYREGQVLSLQGVDADVRTLSRAGASWDDLLSVALEGSFARRHADFPRAAPRRPLPSREMIDAVYEQLIRPGALQVERGDPVGVWAEALMAPMGLVLRSNGLLELTARGSVVLRAVMDLIRARDTASPHELGHAVSCSELARVLFKSSFGLPPQLSELAVAAFCRLGYLVAMDEQERVLVVQDLPAPFAAQVKFVARAPLLGPTDWEAIGRLLRAIGHHGHVAGDYEGQQRAWDTLVAARHSWLARIADIRTQVGDFWEATDQGPEQWRETLEDLDAAEQLFRLIDPSRPGPLGLAEVADAVRSLLGPDKSFGALARFLSRLEALERFFRETAPEMLGVYRYLIHPNLNAPPGSDVALRRDQLLEFLAGGEAASRDLVTFRRLQQVFFVTYARRYMSWHTRVYQSDVYDRCAMRLNTPEFRALERLARLNVQVEHDAGHVRKMVESIVSQRCTYAGLDRALRLSPVCPSCGLQLGDEPDTEAVEAVDEAIRAGLAEYSCELSRPEFRETLRKYMAVLPRWGDLSARLLEIANLSGPLTARQVLTLFTDEVVTHLNRVLAGQIVVPRDLGELRRALHGKALTPEQARQIVLEWLEGSGEDRGEGDELLQFED